MKNLEPAACWLAIIGAINWGLDELGYNVVDMLLGGVAGGQVVSIVYYLVGLSGVYLAAGKLKG